MRARLSQTAFRLCHGRHLVYNTCWEDPLLDRAALNLGPGDRLVMITSAGCNALDYALDGPERIDAVDVNPRQNALLELKQAAIRRLEYEQFFMMFGRGKLPDWPTIYPRQLRPQLTDASRKYWDRCGEFFCGEGRRSSFYFRGSAGWFAWAINGYIDRVARIRPAVDAMLSASSLDEQRDIYLRRLKPMFWGPLIRWVIRRDAALSLLGVPRAQRTQLERYYPGGIGQFIEDRLDEVFARRPLADNYFWRVYLTGQYTRTCCPAYLKPDNFARLQAGLVDRIHAHTTTLLDFLQSRRERPTHFVLLDHMDWMAEHHQAVLARQWQAIVDRSSPGSRLLWRSAALHVEFIDKIRVRVGRREVRLGDVLDYDRDLANRLHVEDRVNTYGSFHIANLDLSRTTLRTGSIHHERAWPAQNAVSTDALAHSR